MALGHVAAACRGFRAFLGRPDEKQALLSAFVERFNEVELDVRCTKEAQVGARGERAGMVAATRAAANGYTVLTQPQPTR